jgi:hypothetical protein
MKHTITQEVEVRYQREIGRYIDGITFIQQNRETLETLNLKFSIWYGSVDFDSLKHPDIIRVIKAFPGKWDKSPSWSGEGIDYTLQHEGGMTIRCYNGEPPAACKIEESVEYILVPERVERKVTRKLICPETTAS